MKTGEEYRIKILKKKKKEERGTKWETVDGKPSLLCSLVQI